MTKQTHTPGPWRARGNIVEYGDRKVIAQCSVDFDLIDTAGGHANARLISALPEMLEALRKVREDVNWMINNQRFLNPSVFDYLDAALSKAESDA